LDEGPRSASLYQSEKQTGQRRLILVVEDNAGDVFLIRAAIKAADFHAELHVVRDGEQAIRFVDDADGDDEAPCPALIILDVNLPRKHGGEVLQHIRKSRRCSNVLVMAVSTSESSRDREDMMKLGANGYFHKPSKYADFMKLGDRVKEMLGPERGAT
jgi:DNA-binding response OmpR family regulator